MSYGIDAASLLSSQYSDSTTTGTTNLRPFANLNLTEDQRTQIRSILQNGKSQGLSRADVQKQIDQVLTPDQQAQSTQASTDPFANLNLTADQKSKIDAILAGAKQNGQSPDQVHAQIDAVLTDAQKTQLATNVQNARTAGSGRRHHHADGGQGSTSTTAAAATATGTTSTTAVTATDMQNQVLAALSVLTKYVQSQITAS